MTMVRARFSNLLDAFSDGRSGKFHFAVVFSICNCLVFFTILNMAVYCVVLGYHGCRCVLLPLVRCLIRSYLYVISLPKIVVCCVESPCSSPSSRMSDSSSFNLSKQDAFSCNPHQNPSPSDAPEPSAPYLLAEREHLYPRFLRKAIAVGLFVVLAIFTWAASYVGGIWLASEEMWNSDYGYEFKIIPIYSLCRYTRSLCLLLTAPSLIRMSLPSLQIYGFDECCTEPDWVTCHCSCKCRLIFGTSDFSVGATMLLNLWGLGITVRYIMFLGSKPLTTTEACLPCCVTPLKGRQPEGNMPPSTDNVDDDSMKCFETLISNLICSLCEFSLLFMGFGLPCWDPPWLPQLSQPYQHCIIFYLATICYRWLLLFSDIADRGGAVWNVDREGVLLRNSKFLWHSWHIVIVTVFKLCMYSLWNLNVFYLLARGILAPASIPEAYPLKDPPRGLNLALQIKITLSRNWTTPQQELLDGLRYFL